MIISNEDLDYFLSKINFKDSNLDAKAIEIMNKLAFTVKKANELSRDRVLLLEQQLRGGEDGAKK